MKHFIEKAILLLAAFSMLSCSTSKFEDRLNDLESRLDGKEGLEVQVGQVYSNALAVRQIVTDNVWISAYEPVKDETTGKEVGYRLSFSDGKVVEVIFGLEASSVIPIVGIDGNGRWIMSLDGGATFSPVTGASNALSDNGTTPQVSVDGEGFWQVSTDGGKTWNRITGADGKPQTALGSAGTYSIFKEVSIDSGKMTFVLSDGQVYTLDVLAGFSFVVEGYSPKATIFPGKTVQFNVNATGLAQAMFNVPDGWSAALAADGTLTVTPGADVAEGEYTVEVVLVSEQGLLKKVELVFQLAGMSEGLLDFSFAGYNHGESAPSEVTALTNAGYKVYNVCDYGAVPDDGKSDREAFLKCLEAALGVSYDVNSNNIICFNSKEKANAVVEFPEGEFILHTSDDDVPLSGKSASRTIQIRSGNFVLRGAGRGKTVLVMQDPAQPSNPSVLYSSPAMIEFKHNSGLTKIADVTSDAAKGSFSVEVASVTGLSEGQWVCLSIVNNDPLLVRNEMKDANPTDAEIARMTNIVNVGVQVYDYHQIKNISGNTVTFYEPLMHEVDLKYTGNTNSSGYNWMIAKYPHYENVGVEDLTFRGNAKEHFVHHGSWQDDGAYKPLNFVRLTQSWMRRVGFESVSEACSVVNSANVSVYDVTISGNRGHAAVRSQASSRVFIGAVKDSADGDLIDSPGTFREGAGQYHAVGVSKQSIGAVLWRNTWGSDSNFESHATQPRATLIDCCTGGWMRYRQGGDEAQVPNHLADLVIWNFNSTTTQSDFIFWDHPSPWWKFMPPVIVGFHGQSVTFDSSQVKYDIGNGSPVCPESLYEQQLFERLGAVPAWLTALK